MCVGLLGAGASPRCAGVFLMVFTLCVCLGLPLAAVLSSRAGSGVVEFPLPSPAVTVACSNNSYNHCMVTCRNRAVSFSPEFLFVGCCGCVLHSMALFSDISLGMAV